jgi:Exopolyphosphatase
MRLAVFDLGTNVFNLLIGCIEEGRFKIEKIIKEPSFIGQAARFSNRLQEEVIESSIRAIGKMIDRYPGFEEVDIVRAVATSAVRDALNKEEFVNAVKERFGIDVEVISGEREATLIYKGIKESMFLYKENVLMLDIGGGSCEFIIADNEKILWKASFQIGVARLRGAINPSDPISVDDVARFEMIMEQVIKPLAEQIDIYKPKVLIGSSGSFDTIRELMFPEDDGSLPAMELPIDLYYKLHSSLLNSTREERVAMPSMPSIRVDYIVFGSLIIDYVIRKCGIAQILQSSYSLKEGYAMEIVFELVSGRGNEA